jgi:hypothetical protein
MSLPKLLNKNSTISNFPKETNCTLPRMGGPEVELDYFLHVFLNIIDAYHSGLRNSCSIFHACLNKISYQNKKKYLKEF